MAAVLDRHMDGRAFIVGNTNRTPTASLPMFWTGATKRADRQLSKSQRISETDVCASQGAAAHCGGRCEPSELKRDQMIQSADPSALRPPAGQRGVLGPALPLRSVCALNQARPRACRRSSSPMKSVCARMEFR